MIWVQGGWGCQSGQGDKVVTGQGGWVVGVVGLCGWVDVWGCRVVRVVRVNKDLMLHRKVSLYT